MGPGDCGGLFASRALSVHMADVCKLKILGFFLAFGMAGLTKEGDAGAEICEGGLSRPDVNLRARPFAFLAFLGDGEVTGRS